MARLNWCECPPRPGEGVVVEPECSVHGDIPVHPAKPYMRYEDWFDPTVPGAEADDADADGRMADWESARVYGA